MYELVSFEEFTFLECLLLIDTLNFTTILDKLYYMEFLKEINTKLVASFHLEAVYKPS